MSQTCESCNRATGLLYEIVYWDDHEDERLAWSPVLDYTISAQYFPDEEVHYWLCEDCYQQLTGTTPPEIPVETLPDISFLLRNLQHSIAIALATTMFETFGYEVRPNGYENTNPEWTQSMKGTDPNMSVIRIRSKPDLFVYDKSANSLYEVEIKTTMQSSSQWDYPKPPLNKLAYFYSSAILLVYFQREHRFLVQKVSAIQWSTIPVVSKDNGREYYRLDAAATFREPNELFDRIEFSEYIAFIEQAKSVLLGFNNQS